MLRHTLRAGGFETKEHEETAENYEKREHCNSLRPLELTHAAGGLRKCFSECRLQ